jgi:hypothetical protein
MPCRWPPGGRELIRYTISNVVYNIARCHLLDANVVHNIARCHLLGAHVVHNIARCH